MKVSPVHRFPTIFRVTTRTLRTIGAFVRIGVTSRTILHLHLRKVILALRTLAAAREFFTRWGMAGRTFHFEMFGFQFKGGGVVIKDFSRRKRSGRMTARARLSGKLRIKHSLVFVHMTIFTVAALLAWKDKLFASFGRLRCQNYVFRRFVTIHAGLLKLLMRACDLEIGLIMIKL